MLHSYIVIINLVKGINVLFFRGEWGSLGSPAGGGVLHSIVSATAGYPDWSAGHEVGLLGLNSFNSSSARFVEANGRHTDVGKQSSGNEVSVHPRSAW